MNHKQETTQEYIAMLHGIVAHVSFHSISHYKNINYLLNTCRVSVLHIWHYTLWNIYADNTHSLHNERLANSRVKLSKVTQLKWHIATCDAVSSGYFICTQSFHVTHTYILRLRETIYEAVTTVGVLSSLLKFLLSFQGSFFRLGTNFVWPLKLFFQ